MKKRIAVIIFALVMVFSASSCAIGFSSRDRDSGRNTDKAPDTTQGKDEEKIPGKPLDKAEQFIQAVVAVGMVDNSAACRKKIKDAADLYDTLSAGDKARVEVATALLRQKSEQFYGLTGEVLFAFEGLILPDPPNPVDPPDPPSPPLPDYSAYAGKYYIYVDGIKQSDVWWELRADGAWGGADGDTVVWMGRFTIIGTAITMDITGITVYIGTILDGVLTLNEVYEGSVLASLVFKKDGSGPVTPPVSPRPEFAACTFFDDFNGTALDEEKWGFEEGGGGFGNGESQHYRRQNAVVSDGTLKLVAKRESYGGNSYTSAKIWTRDKFSQSYGRFQARIRLTTAHQGFWPAFWMMPQSSVYGGWPRSGEIDIMEMRGREPFNASSCLHSGSGGGSTYAGADLNPLNAPGFIFDVRDFHTYTCEWEKGKISFYIDGALLYSNLWNGQRTVGNAPRTLFGANNYTWQAGGATATAADPAPFDQDFYMILNFAIGGQFDGYRLPPNEAFMSGNSALTGDPALEVDYVAVYDMEYMLANPLA
ncbi:MAG: glycoside hydrolase family 16 protein [Firmicutes bacterium]|nr:glycoside hydrolase family 16 protein [Bacillota bacterium]